jgi:hypothetical protein
MSQRPSSAQVSKTSRASTNLRPATATAREGGAASRMAVAVRLRPANKSDPDGAQVVVTRDAIDTTVVTVDDGKRGRNFGFDHVFCGGQEEVFEAIGRPMIAEAFKGFNVCLFAYGQTGSGKTYSIQGGTGEEEGVVPRFVREMFRAAQERANADADLTVKVTMTYLEVYMERVRDLLAPRVKGQEPESLELQEVNKRVAAKGVSVHAVLGPERVGELMALGNANRQVAETRMNEVSSRSHSIVQFTVSQLHESVDRRDTECIVTLVDLAGSERQGKTESSGLQFEEAKKINQSLLSLGRALNSFSDGRGDMVSLRESKLTRLLSDCFGGNAKTWMLATIAPTAYNLTESLSTLEYATHAKNITNRVTINARQRQAQLAELRTIVAHLTTTADTERDDLEELRTVVHTLEQENVELHKSLVTATASAASNPLRQRLARELESQEELRRLIASLQSSTADLAVGRIGAKRTFVGNFGFTLECVVNNSGIHEYVSLVPVHGDLVLDALVEINADERDTSDDAANPVLAWSVSVVSIRGLPANAGGTCAVRFAMDPDAGYEAPLAAVTSPECPVDLRSSFYLPYQSDALVKWVCTHVVMIIEVTVTW